ncbi:MAG: hypothetical protein HFJ80_04035 [Clostridiales bacterium]|nr:hypothetical protein [Clostridiales bacterium]
MRNLVKKAGCGKERTSRGLQPEPVGKTYKKSQFILDFFQESYIIKPEISHSHLFLNKDGTESPSERGMMYGTQAPDLYQ